MPIPGESRATHVAYADEAYHNVGRFRSVGVVTLSLDDDAALTNDVAALVADSGQTELKWMRLRQARDRFAAEKVLTWAVSRVVEGRLRIEVLIWDTRDERHAIPGRSDAKNLERMYYHLFRQALGRSGGKAVWRICPDENGAIDWETMHEVLGLRKPGQARPVNLFGDTPARYAVEQVTPVSSKVTPLVQVADLFAGLAAYSYESHDAYRAWNETRSGQLGLFGTSLAEPQKTDSYRFKVLSAFHQDCKAKALGVGLSSEGLRTYSATTGLNFWLYVPQRADDKAPRRAPTDRR